MKDTENVPEWVLSNLCYYDLRNPCGVISNYSPEEIEEEGHTIKAKEECFCESCFGGNTKLAEYIINLITQNNLIN